MTTTKDERMTTSTDRPKVPQRCCSNLAPVAGIHRRNGELWRCPGCSRTWIKSTDADGSCWWNDPTVPGTMRIPGSYGARRLETGLRLEQIADARAALEKSLGIDDATKRADMMRVAMVRLLDWADGHEYDHAREAAGNAVPESGALARARADEAAFGRAVERLAPGEADGGAGQPPIPPLMPHQEKAVGWAQAQAAGAAPAEMGEEERGMLWIRLRAGYRLMDEHANGNTSLWDMFPSAAKDMERLLRELDTTRPEVSARAFKQACSAMGRADITNWPDVLTELAAVRTQARTADEIVEACALISKDAPSDIVAERIRALKGTFAASGTVLSKCAECGTREAVFCKTCVEDGTAVPPAVPVPIPMFLTCPLCKARHVDAGDFTTKRHHTHACQSCGAVWRPAIEPTVGVQFLPGFKDKEPNEADACAKAVECQKCGKVGGHVFSIDVDGGTMSLWVCPYCVARAKSADDVVEACAKAVDFDPVLDAIPTKDLRREHAAAIRALKGRWTIHDESGRACAVPERSRVTPAVEVRIKDIMRAVHEYAAAYRRAASPWARVPDAEQHPSYKSLVDMLNAFGAHASGTGMIEADTLVCAIATFIEEDERLVKISRHPATSGENIACAARVLAAFRGRYALDSGTVAEAFDECLRHLEGLVMSTENDAGDPEPWGPAILAPVRALRARLVPSPAGTPRQGDDGPSQAPRQGPPSRRRPSPFERAERCLDNPYFGRHSMNAGVRRMLVDDIEREMRRAIEESNGRSAAQMKNALNAAEAVFRPEACGAKTFPVGTTHLMRKAVEAAVAALGIDAPKVTEGP